MTAPAALHRIVIVGGGAGGLELATALGDSLGRRGRAEITLVDAALTHIWKPLLHEIAAGTLDSHDDDLDYLAQAHWHGFQFRLGRLERIDRAHRSLTLAPTLDADGVEIVPRREFPYDTLVLAVGSVSNDFGIPGADEHCFFLDTHAQADAFNAALLNTYLRAQTQSAALQSGQLTVAIVGGGATGVELAAELRNAARALVAYGLDRIDPERDVKLVLIQAGERLLPELPLALAEATRAQLQALGVEVRLGERVTAVTADGVHTHAGHFIAATTKVWAAGIKAPDVLRALDGLEVNRINQLMVRPTLQTTRDDNIFALGDCAACPQGDGGTRTVPPRAQAAHQQARLLRKSLRRRLRGRSLPAYIYKDYGSLISLGQYSTVGNLMGNLLGNVRVSGRLARWMYLSLYKMHQLALHGALPVALTTVANWLTRPTRPRLKLH